MAEEAPPSGGPRTGKGGGVKGMLTRKVGPAPLWVWVFVLSVLLAYFIIRRQRAAAAASGDTTSTDTSGSGSSSGGTDYSGIPAYSLPDTGLMGYSGGDIYVNTTPSTVTQSVDTSSTGTGTKTTSSGSPDRYVLTGKGGLGAGHPIDYSYLQSIGVIKNSGGKWVATGKAGLPANHPIDYQYLVGSGIAKKVG